jgi:hypothetical protein
MAMSGSLQSIASNYNGQTYTMEGDPNSPIEIGCGYANGAESSPTCMAVCRKDNTENGGEIVRLIFFFSRSLPSLSRILSFSFRLLF